MAPTFAPHFPFILSVYCSPESAATAAAAAAAAASSIFSSTHLSVWLALFLLFLLPLLNCFLTALTGSQFRHFQAGGLGRCCSFFDSLSLSLLGCLPCTTGSDHLRIIFPASLLPFFLFLLLCTFWLILSLSLSLSLVGPNNNASPCNCLMH